MTGTYGWGWLTRQLWNVTFSIAVDIHDNVSFNVTLEYVGIKCPEDQPNIESFIGSYQTEELFRHEYRSYLEARTGGAIGPGTV